MTMNEMSENTLHRPKHWYHAHGRYVLAIILALAGTIAALLLCGGCATTSTVTTNPDGTLTTNTVTTLDTAKTTNAINAAVPVLVRLAVAKEPACKQYLQDVMLAIILFTQTSQTLDPADLNNALTATGVGALQTPETQAAIDTVVALYQVYFGNAVAAKLAKPQWLIPVLQSLAEGIQKGLAN